MCSSDLNGNHEEPFLSILISNVGNRFPNYSIPFYRKCPALFYFFHTKPDTNLLPPPQPTTPTAELKANKRKNTAVILHNENT